MTAVATGGHGHWQPAALLSQDAESRAAGNGI